MNEGRHEWYRTAHASLVAAYGAVPYPAVVIGWNQFSSAGCGHVDGDLGNLAFLKVRGLCESALVFKTAALVRRMKFQICSLDAAHRGCELFRFEFFHSSMTAVNGVLPVDGVNGSALSGVPFCSQA